MQTIQDWQPTPDDLVRLVPYLPDMYGAEGGIDDRGLYWYSRDNPDGHWGWYEIGGQWDGVTALQPYARDDLLGAIAPSPQNCTSVWYSRRARACRSCVRCSVPLSSTIILHILCVLSTVTTHGWSIT